LRHYLKKPIKAEVWPVLKLPINCYQVLNLDGKYNKKPAAKHRAEGVSSRSILQ